VSSHARTHAERDRAKCGKIKAREWGHDDTRDDVPRRVDIALADRTGRRPVHECEVVFECAANSSPGFNPGVDARKECRCQVRIDEGKEDRGRRSLETDREKELAGPEMEPVADLIVEPRLREQQLALGKLTDNTERIRR
jgi:hypothetical protein